MSGMDLQFVTEFYKELENNDIKYCILRNADEVEAGDAHDIDMTVDVLRQQEAEKVLFMTAKKFGWALHLKTGNMRDTMNIKCYHFFKQDDDELSIVHFDFFPTFSWKKYLLINNTELLQAVNEDSVFHAASPSIEAVTKLFIRLLYNGYIKEKYKPDIYKTFMREQEKVLSVMRNFMDEESASNTWHMVSQQNWGLIEKNREMLIQSIKKVCSQNVFDRIRYIVEKYMEKPGCMVAFEGTDGSGKSTIIEGIKPVLENTFPDGMFDYYHWRPGVIKKETKVKDGKVIVVSAPHNQKPYGKLMSFAKFMFFNLDYVIGYWVKVRWQLAKGHLVVFDRYYYDYYLDKIRYRLDINDSILAFFQFLIPKPDETFLLVGDPKILYERKREISVEEIEQQIIRLLGNKHRFANPIEIDVNQSIDRVVLDVSQAILSVCSKRYKK